MSTDLADKQWRLYALADTFERLRAFDLELRRRTKYKRFRVANDLAFRAVRSLERMLIVDLAAWVKDLHAGWLRVHLSKLALANLRASKRDARKRAAQSWIEAPPEDQGFLRAAFAEDVLETRRAALRRLFGEAVARRGQATGADVLKLEARLEKWAGTLHQARNTQAHPLGLDGPSVFLTLPRVAAHFHRCGRLMNDLRLLVLDETMGMPFAADRARSDPHAEDLVDLVLLGTIEYSTGAIAKMPGGWVREKREAYYAALHRRRRRKRADAFNEPL